jgi:hypothetical protein
VLRVACLTVMRKPGPTLILVPPLLNNKQFRAPFTADLDDPEGLKGFWEWYEATPPPLRAQVIGPVLARLRSFLLRDFVRATLGPATSSFDTGKVLDGGVLIARLPKGQIGEETAKLMGSFVLASVWQAATAAPCPNGPAATPPSTSTRRTTCSTSPDPSATCSPRPAATTSRWCSPTRTSPNCPATPNWRCPPTPSPSPASSRDA